MKPFLQQLTLGVIVLTLILCGIGQVQAQQKSSDLQSQAQEFLKNYKPPEAKLAPPTETPEESWKNQIQKQQARNVAVTLPPRVNVMPSYGTSTTYANALAGSPIAVWGNVNEGVSPFRYILDYGDGTVDSGDVTNTRYIGNNHTYSTAGTKTMTLTVRDNTGATDMEQATIRVYAAATTQINVNIAIEKGLLYLYQNQYSSGYWTDNSDLVASTGGALLCFEENGHRPTNSYNSDIYAEYVRLGLDWLFSYQASYYSIYAQSAGDPDVNGDGLGAYISPSTYPNGIANLAILAAHADTNAMHLDTIHTGTLNGWTYYKYVRNMADQWMFSQTEGSAPSRGGWRYAVNTPNYGDQDNSTTQWAALNLNAAENLGFYIPSFVKSELLVTLGATQNANGGFSYNDNYSWMNVTKTAAAIGSYVFTGATSSNPVIDTAIGFLNAHWTDAYDVSSWTGPFNGNTYGMYAVAKGMRIINGGAGNQFIRSHDWYAEFVDHLLNNATYKQNSNGSWPRNTGYYPTAAMGDPLNSSLAILVLTKGVLVAPPVAVISPISARPPNISFIVDGSSSYHQDPSKQILQYLWDWDASNGVNFGSPDATGQSPTNPGYSSNGVYTITLRVIDNSTPPLTSDITTTVTISDTANHPPIAVAIPPGVAALYAGRVNEPILLDGSSSHDPDYPNDSVVAYNWDTDGNGVYGDATTPTTTVTFSNEYNGQVGLRVYDTHGDSSTNSAYITVVASRKDIFVESFDSSPYYAGVGKPIHLVAVFKNNDTSNAGASNVLVRFYDEDPLTTGNQMGGNYFVDLPVGGRDTIDTYINLPNLPEGDRQIYVYLDPTLQVDEWDETNNIAGSDVNVGTWLTVRGMKFNDLNGDSIKNESEPGLKDWEITINDLERSVKTDANGYYEFTGVPAGTHFVREESQPGWTQTYPAGGTWTISSAVESTLTNIDFGNRVLANAEVHGMKFNDLNGNGVKDELEPGLKNWVIFLETAPSSFSASGLGLYDTTDANGEYSFTGLSAGTYRISEVQQPGWSQTYPESETYTLSLSYTTVSTGNDFGNHLIAGISGLKFNDLNGNGTKDSGEPGLSGWQIVMNGTDTVVTDEDGNFVFMGLTTGTYTFTEVQQAGWVQTTSNPAPVNYTYGETVENIYFGNFKTANVSGLKWHDADGDGIIDDSELFLSGWVIKAQKDANTKLDTTDAGGAYSFTFAPSDAGTWTISEVAQDGWSQTYPTGGTYTIVVQSGLDNATANFGNAQPGSIAGSKFNDIAGDSSTASDPKLSGWIIKLFKDSVNVAQQATDGSGNYQFNNVLPGTYVVQESLQTGWIQTFPTPAGSVPALANGNEGPRAYSITVGSGAAVTGKDFANFELGSISGTKFHDIDGDSIKDGGEPGLEGRVLQLFNDTTLVASDTSDENGAYSFDGLTAGTYNVSEVIPQDWYQTMPASGSYTVSITSGSNETGRNFGNAQYGSISGRKFYDHDSTGTFDEICEVYSAGHQIVLVGTHIPPETTVTDANGNFTFDPIPADNYILKEATNSLWTQTYPANGNPYSLQLLSGVDTAGFMFGNFYWPDTGKYRTFTITEYNKSAGARQKSGFAKKPTAGNVRDTVHVGRGFDSQDGYLMVGVERPDSALFYGWYHYALDGLHPYKASAVKHWIYNLSAVKLVTKTKLPGKPKLPKKPTDYISAIGDNRAESEIGNALNFGQAHFITYLTNIGASDMGVTPSGLGDLVYACTKNADQSDTILLGKSLREIAYFWDTVLTMGRLIRGPHDTLYRYDRSYLRVLDSFVVRLNSAFSNPVLSAKLDTFSTKPLRVKGFKSLYQVPYLRRVPNAAQQLRHFDRSQVGEAKPAAYKLEQNYPNPFNPTTTIEFELKQQSKVTLKIFNLLGQEVATILDNQDLDEGNQMIEFNATDFSSGIYFYRLEANGTDEHGQKFTFTSVKKMTLVK